MPPNPAFDRFVDASGPSADEGYTALNNAERQMKAVSAYQAKHQTSFEQAWTAVSAEKPEMFNN